MGLSTVYVCKTGGFVAGKRGPALVIGMPKGIDNLLALWYGENENPFTCTEGGAPMGITSQKIAELAGVSRGTVDRALNHRGGVKPQVQRRIEELMRTLLGVLAQALIQPSEPIDEDQLRELDLLLQDSRKRAFAHRDNSFSRDMDYYARYMDMRREQYRILERLFLARSRLTEVSRQSYLVANFMRSMAFSLHEYNNAEDLLRELELIRRHFQSGKLPVTRPEFENRAVLYEIVFELRQLLLLKQNFAASLTPSQIRLFWKEAPQTKWE